MPLVRSASLNLLFEIVIRISLFSLFCYMETMTPFERIIHKEDLVSQYGYPRTDSYVPGGMLWAIVVAVPCVLSLLAWAGYSDCDDALEILLAWSLAVGMNGIITDFFKLIVGRPRPDFMYRCFPDGVITADMKCTGNPADVREGRKSFPSGHSSLSFCSLGILSLWLCGRLGVLSTRRGSSPRLVACLAPLMGAAAIALSRINDYHHHWQDVLVGSLIGFSTSIFIYRQYYHPLSSDQAGVPYVVAPSAAKYGPVTDSPVAEREGSPLLNGKKEDKWI